MRTLVLDQGYQPHRVISWKRAVTLFFAGKVEVVEEYDEDIRSVSITIKMPSVVRMLRKVRGRKRAIKFSRMNVASRFVSSLTTTFYPALKAERPRGRTS